MKLQAKFWLWIGAGIVFFGLVFGLTNLPEQSVRQWPCEQGQSHPAGQQLGSNQAPNGAPLHESDPADKYDPAANCNPEPGPPLSPFRLTLSDALLGLFT